MFPEKASRKYRNEVRSAWSRQNIAQRVHHNPTFLTVAIQPTISAPSEDKYVLCIITRQQSHGRLFITTILLDSTPGCAEPGASSTDTMRDENNTFEHESEPLF